MELLETRSSQPETRRLTSEVTEFEFETSSTTRTELDTTDRNSIGSLDTNFIKDCNQLKQETSESVISDISSSRLLSESRETSLLLEKHIELPMNVPEFISDSFESIKYHITQKSLDNLECFSNLTYCQTGSLVLPTLKEEPDETNLITQTSSSNNNNILLPPTTLSGTTETNKPSFITNQTNIHLNSFNSSLETSNSSVKLETYKTPLGATRGRKPKKVSTETPEARQKRLAADAARKRQSRMLRKIELSQFLQPNHVIEARQQRLAAEAARKRHGRLLQKLESVGLNTNSLFVEGRIQPQPQPQPIPLALTPSLNFNGQPPNTLMDSSQLSQNFTDTSSSVHTALASPRNTLFEIKLDTPTIQHRSIAKVPGSKPSSVETSTSRYRAIAPALPTLYSSQYVSLPVAHPTNSFSPNHPTILENLTLPYDHLSQLKPPDSLNSSEFGDAYGALPLVYPELSSSHFESFSPELANLYQPTLYHPPQPLEAPGPKKRGRKKGSTKAKLLERANLLGHPVKKPPKVKPPKLDADGNPLPPGSKRPRKGTNPDPPLNSESTLPLALTNLPDPSPFRAILPVSAPLPATTITPSQIFVPQDQATIDLFHSFQL